MKRTSVRRKRSGGRGWIMWYTSDAMHTTNPVFHHIVGETLLAASIAVFHHSLVSIRVSSAYCILSLKTARVDLLMRGF